MTIEEDLLKWDLRGIFIRQPLVSSWLYQLEGHLSYVRGHRVVLDACHTYLRHEGNVLRIMVVLLVPVVLWSKELGEPGLGTYNGSQSRFGVAEDLLLLILIAQVDLHTNILHRGLWLLSCLMFNARRNLKQLSQLGVGRLLFRVLERGCNILEL